MNLEELGYILYMESQDLKNKSYEDLTEDQKLNLELNPLLDVERATKDDNLVLLEQDPINIPPQ